MSLVVGHDCAKVGVGVANVDRCRIIALDVDRWGSAGSGDGARKLDRDLAIVAEDWLGKWAMNLMLINVSTRKFRRAVRLPEGDVPAPALPRGRRLRYASPRSV